MRAMFIPEGKPAIESIRGRWERKMSPRRRHAILQSRISILLTAWAGGRGEVGSEWRFYLSPPDQEPSSLVPDVAYVSFERLPLALGEAREKPEIAPDIAVEILSPGDRVAVLEEKVTLYLGSGAFAVVIVDPIERTVDVREIDGTRGYRSPEAVAFDSFPDLSFDTAKLFDGI
jgi:Uma2 family endonuclease